jgi:hypothetical protein
MKKLLVTLGIVLSMSFFAQAQVNPHAIGLRLGGDGTSSGAEISYQHRVGQSNRFEFDLGFNGHDHYNNIFLSGTYQWDWNLVGGLNWYVGPGAAIGFYNWDDKNENSSGLYLGVGGQIGLEFDFNHIGAPILLSIDTRPMFDVAGYDTGFGWGVALGVRYTW